jgi:hypothetical protein
MSLLGNQARKTSLAPNRPSASQKVQWTATKDWIHDRHALQAVGAAVHWGELAGNWPVAQHATRPSPTVAVTGVFYTGKTEGALC